MLLLTHAVHFQISSKPRFPFDVMAWLYATLAFVIRFAYFQLLQLEASYPLYCCFIMLTY